MKKHLIILTTIIITNVLNSQVIEDSTNVNVTVIREKNFAGSAVNWKINMNGEFFTKLENGKYCTKTISCDSIALVGKVVGAEAGWGLLLQKENTYVVKPLDKKDYYFIAKLGSSKGMQIIKYTSIDKAEAEAIIPKLKMADTYISSRPRDFVQYDKSPKVIQKVEPVYPDSALKLNLEGRVTCKIWIDKMGDVRDIEIIRSSSDLFTQPAMDAVKQYKFAPARFEEAPIDIWMPIMIPFKLDAIEEKQ